MEWSKTHLKSICTAIRRIKTLDRRFCQNETGSAQIVSESIRNVTFELNHGPKYRDSRKKSFPIVLKKIRTIFIGLKYYQLAQNLLGIILTLSKAWQTRWTFLELFLYRRWPKNRSGDPQCGGIILKKIRTIFIGLKSGQLAGILLEIILTLSKAWQTRWTFLGQDF